MPTALAGDAARAVRARLYQLSWRAACRHHQANAPRPGPLPPPSAQFFGGPGGAPGGGGQPPWPRAERALWGARQRQPLRRCRAGAPVRAGGLAAARRVMLERAMPWVKAARRIRVYLNHRRRRQSQQTRRGERCCPRRALARMPPRRSGSASPAWQQVADAHHARRDRLEGLRWGPGRDRRAGRRVTSPQQQAGGQGEHEGHRGGDLQPPARVVAIRPAPSASPVPSTSGAQRDGARRGCPVGGEDARLRMTRRRGRTARRCLRGGCVRCEGEHAAAEQRQCDRGLARHPRAADVTEDVERAPRSADLEPDAEQPERDEDEAGGGAADAPRRPARLASRQQDEPAAAAAAG